MEFACDLHPKVLDVLNEMLWKILACSEVETSRKFVAVRELPCLRVTRFKHDVTSLMRLSRPRFQSAGS